MGRTRRRSARDGTITDARPNKLRSARSGKRSASEQRQDVSLSADGRILTVHIPIALQARSQRKAIITPDGLLAVLVPAERAAPPADPTLLKALARAHRWRDMLESGEFASIRALAKAERINESYLNRMLRMTWWAPGNIEQTIADL